MNIYILSPPPFQQTHVEAYDGDRGSYISTSWLIYR